MFSVSIKISCIKTNPLSLAFSFFPIIDLPHLAVEDKRQETSGGDKLPHYLDKKSEKRETHTNPFRNKGRMTKREKRETSSYLIHSLSLCRLTHCFSRINHHNKEGEVLFLWVEIWKDLFFALSFPSLFLFFLKEEASCLTATFETMTFVTKEIQDSDKKNTKRCGFE